jgi:hypothetical protein
MKYVRLNVSNKQGEQLVEKGAFYSQLLQGWYVNSAQLQYPQSNKSIFAGLKSNEYYEPITEADLKCILIEQLSKDFVVHDEVSGVHCLGGRYAIDLVIQPRNKTGWKNPSVAMGIELKKINPDSKTDYTHWVKQCIDYSLTNWDGFGHIPVFMGPGAFDYYNANRDIRSLLSSYRIGFVDSVHGFQLVLAEKRVWCQYHGVQDMGKRSNMRPYFGARR